LVRKWRRGVADAVTKKGQRNYNDQRISIEEEDDSKQTAPPAFSFRPLLFAHCLTQTRISLRLLAVKRRRAMNVELTENSN
jgi:hypothetical protein